MISELPDFHSRLNLPEELRLTVQDLRILNEVKRQKATLCAQIRAVVAGDPNAFFLWGPGGHGKSQVVRDCVEDCPRVRWNTTSVSPRGLFNLLQEYPLHLHVFEDMETMYKNADCQALLRAACGGQSAAERRVCWEKDGLARAEPFQFGGGIIIISNEDPMGGSMKMRALASRFAPQKWELTEPELAASMRHIALYTPCRYGLAPTERLEVAEFVIREMANRSAGVCVDLRTFCEHALPAYHQWKEGERLVAWQEVVRAKIKGGPKRSHDQILREERMRAACEAHFAGNTKEQRVAAWKAKMSMGPSQFYKYLGEAKEEGMFTAYQARQAKN